MQKIAIVILADTDTGEGLGRLVNALTAAKEYQEAGDKVSVTFTGAGTKWLAELSNQAHTAHALYMDVKDSVAGACGYCANAFNQQDAIDAVDVPMLCEFGTSMSYRKLTQEADHLIIF